MRTRVPISKITATDLERVKTQSLPLLLMIVISCGAYKSFLLASFLAPVGSGDARRYIFEQCRRQHYAAADRPLSHLRCSTVKVGGLSRLYMDTSESHCWVISQLTCAIRARGHRGTHTRTGSVGLDRSAHTPEHFE